MTPVKGHAQHTPAWMSSDYQYTIQPYTVREHSVFTTKRKHVFFYVGISYSKVQLERVIYFVITSVDFDPLLVPIQLWTIIFNVKTYGRISDMNNILQLMVRILILF